MFSFSQAYQLYCLHLNLDLISILRIMFLFVICLWNFDLFLFVCSCKMLSMFLGVGDVGIIGGFVFRVVTEGIVIGVPTFFIVTVIRSI